LTTHPLLTRSTDLAVEHHPAIPQFGTDCGIIEPKLILTYRTFVLGFGGHLRVPDGRSEATARTQRHLERWATTPNGSWPVPSKADAHSGPSPMGSESVVICPHR
jgi:hypothetical protein